MATARRLTDVDRDLAHYAAEAARLPLTHPDHAVVHAILNNLLAERERMQVWRPSRVLARR